MPAIHPGYGRYMPIVHPGVWEVYAHSTPWYIHPGYTTPVYTPPWVHLVHTRCTGCHRCTDRGQMMMPWAQDGDIAWVRASRIPLGPKSVTVVMVLMRRLLALPVCYRMEDWIDEGCILGYSLRLGPCCAEPSLFHAPSNR